MVIVVNARNELCCGAEEALLLVFPALWKYVYEIISALWWMPVGGYYAGMVTLDEEREFYG